MLSIIQRDQWSVRGALSAAAKILVTRVELRIIQQPRRSELNQSSFLGAPRVGDLDALNRQGDSGATSMDPAL
jgi:hypothetical protein